MLGKEALHFIVMFGGDLFTGSMMTLTIGKCGEVRTMISPDRRVNQVF